MPAPARALLAELAGTFLLVFAGTGAIMVDARTDGEVGDLGVSVAFGLAIATGVFTTRRVSGAHFNPAISLAMTAVRRFPAAGIAPYVTAQLAGAFGASLLLRALLGDDASLGATEPSVAIWKAFVIEVVATAVLAFVIARVAADGVLPDMLAALAIGATVGLGSLVAGPLTGGSMNPARSFAPAVVALRLEDVWLYWLAPPIGACLGALLFSAIDAPPEEP